ncbi:MAG: tetratricopeptide repeat protein [Limibacillus sp.]
MERRLTCILAADVVGYSHLMESAEAETLAALKAHREELFDNLVKAHHGRIFKLMGDGSLAEFASVVDAVTCAISIQEGMVERNARIPEAERVRFRIGIHLGDVIVESDDLYGDGVNVAARLEAMAAPDGLCISRQAYDQIGGKLRSRFEDLGDQQLKNISRPVQVFRLTQEGQAPPEPFQRGTKGRRAPLFAALVIAVLAVPTSLYWWQQAHREQPKDSMIRPPPAVSEHPRLAVLPFENISGDAEQEYFADGMTEDLVTDLAKISSISVLARASTAGLKGREIDFPSVGDELRVRYFIGGSVRKSGNKVRINAQLIDAQSGNQIWAERYDGEEIDVFGLQDQVLEKVIDTLALKLSEEERQRLTKRGTKSIAAHDLYLKGLHAASVFSEEGNRQAIGLYKQALSIDPNYPLPYAGISNVLQLNARNGWSDDVQGDLRTAVDLAQTAVDLDPNNPTLHWSLGRSKARLRTPEALAEGIESVKRAIELDSDYADAYAFLAVLYVGAGKAEDALRSVDTAMRLNPTYPFWYLFMRGTAYYALEQYDTAITDFETAAELNPTAQFVRFWLAAAYAQAGRPDDAEWQVDELMIMGFDGTVDTIVETGHIIDPKYLALEREGLLKAGIPE